MIRFLDTAFIRGRTFTAGMIADFDDPTEAQLIEAGDAEAFSTAIKPVEMLACSAVPVACTLSGVDEVLASFMIPDGVITTNSIIQIDPLWSFPTSANSKILRVKVAGMMIYNVTRSAALREAPLIVLANRNSMTSQIAPYYDGVYITASVNSPTTYSIDLTGNVAVEILGQRASASESLKLEYYRATHFAL